MLYKLTSMAVICLCFLVVSAGDLSADSTIVVSDWGNDLSGNGTLGNPYATIQKGIDEASNTDTVQVTPGTYIGDGNRDINTSGKAIMIWGPGGPDVTIISPGGTAYNGFNVSLNGEDTSTVIDGFTIAGCDIGINILASYPKIENMKFVSNNIGIKSDSPGAFPVCRFSTFMTNDTGIVSYGAAADDFLIDSCVFDSNIFCGIYGDFHVYNSTIRKSITGLGANSSFPGYRFAADNCDIRENSDTTIRAGDQTTLTNCRIQDNSGIIAYGHSLSLQYVVIDFDSCQIDNNDKGMNLNGEDVYLTMSNTRFSENGGRIRYVCSYRGEVSVSNSVFINNDSSAFNISSLEKGATFTKCIFANSKNENGLNISDVGLDLVIGGCTFTGNYADGVSAGIIGGGLKIDSSIFCDNGGYGISVTASIGADTSISCNDVYNNAAADYSGIADFTGLNGNISADPQFCSVDDNDFHLTFPSPCMPPNNTCGLLMGALGPGCDQLRPLKITAYSPVNLWVTDPEGYYIGKDAYGVLFQTLFPADYFEEAPDYYDEVVIYYPIEGDYDIQIIPEDDAPPGSTYSIGIQIDGSAQCVVILNEDVPASGSTDSYTYTVEDDYHYINGDANGTETVNILDATFIINYLYREGPAPYPEMSADANCNLAVNILDVTYIINYLYREGPAPCELGL